jgi:hypothetical protein
MVLLCSFYIHTFTKSNSNKENYITNLASPVPQPPIASPPDAGAIPSQSGRTTRAPPILYYNHQLHSVQQLLSMEENRSSSPVFQGLVSLLLQCAPPSEKFSFNHKRTASMHHRTARISVRRFGYAGFDGPGEALVTRLDCMYLFVPWRAWYTIQYTVCVS